MSKPPKCTDVQHMIWKRDDHLLKGESVGGASRVLGTADTGRKSILWRHVVCPSVPWPGVWSLGGTGAPEPGRVLAAAPFTPTLGLRPSTYGPNPTLWNPSEETLLLRGVRTFLGGRAVGVTWLTQSPAPGLSVSQVTHEGCLQREGFPSGTFPGFMPCQNCELQREILTMTEIFICLCPERLGCQSLYFLRV